MWLLRCAWCGLFFDGIQNKKKKIETKKEKERTEADGKKLKMKLKITQEDKGTQSDRGRHKGE